MINLDISTLAILPSAQNDVAKFITQALNLGKYNLPSRYILQHVEWNLSNLSNAAISRYFYPDVPTAQAASRSVGTGHDPIFVGEIELFFMPTTLIGPYSFTVLYHSQTPQNSDLETYAFYSSDVTNTMVPFQIARLVLPYVPTFEIKAEASSSAAGGRVDFEYRVMYNGRFFTGL